METNVSVSETIAAVGFLTASESLIEGGIQSQGNMQSVDYKQYITDDRQVPSQGHRHIKHFNFYK